MNRLALTSLLIWLSLACFLLTSACSEQTAGQSEGAVKGSALPAAALHVEPVRPEAVQAVFERSCKLCHGPDGHGIAAVAPDLRRAPRRNAQDWEQYLRDPKSFYPDSPMHPAQEIGDEEIKAVAAYLAVLTQQNPLPREAEANR
jgi:mono/diheme cytochrome c family protein